MKVQAQKLRIVDSDRINNGTADWGGKNKCDGQGHQEICTVEKREEIDIERLIKESALGTTP